MPFRKYTASRVFNGREFLPDDTVIVVKDDGVIEALLPTGAAGDDVQPLDGILLPGLINAHCHLELSHLKGQIPEGTGMTDFILAILGKRGAAEEAIREAIAQADREMHAEGIVAVGDICNTAYTIEQKKISGIHYRNFLEVSGFHPDLALPRFQAIEETWKRFKQELPHLESTIVPHAPYSVSPLLFEKVIHHNSTGLHSLHNQECIAEQDLFRDRSGDLVRLYEALGVQLDFFTPTGRSSLRSVLPHFLPEQQLLLVHNVTTNHEDLAFLDAHKDILPQLYFCLCPSANAYIGNGYPDPALLQQSPIPLVLGTDSLASNHRLSIVEEMRHLQRVHPGIGFATLLQMATYNGAMALGIDSQYGSLEVGKAPGLTLLRGVGEGNGLEIVQGERVL